MRTKFCVIKSIAYVFNVFTSGFLFTTGTTDFFFFIIVIAGFVVSLVVFVVFTFWVVIVNGFFAARVVLAELALVDSCSVLSAIDVDSATSSVSSLSSSLHGRLGRRGGGELRLARFIAITLPRCCILHSCCCLLLCEAIEF